MAKIKKPDEEKIAVAASQIKTLFMLANSMDIDSLKEAREPFADAISKYETIGFIESHNYLLKDKKNKAKLARLDALIKLIEILRETNEVLTGKSSEDMNILRILGL